jgi:murein endopeptidase
MAEAPFWQGRFRGGHNRHQHGLPVGKYPERRRSALMREPDKAAKIIEAVVKSAGVP